MKKRNFLAQSLLPIVITGLLLSCGNSTPSQTDEQLKLDSLNSLAKKQQVHIGEMEEFITSLSLTMDSINMQEKELVGEGDLEKKKKTSKETIIKNLREYKELIKRQRQKIASLEKQLSAKNEHLRCVLQRKIWYVIILVVVEQPWLLLCKKTGNGLAWRWVTNMKYSFALVLNK